MQLKKWMNKAVAVTLSLVMISQIGGGAITALAKGDTGNESLKVGVLSDTHYFPSSMFSDCDDYTTAMNSDRKMFSESEAILDEAIQMVVEDEPDIVLVSGDLTKDGEYKGHQEFAGKLAELEATMEEKGVNTQVYVINGNHDINNSNAMDYSSGHAVAAQKTSPDEFKEIYEGFGYGEAAEIFTPAEGKQAGQLSYTIELDGYTIIAIDSGIYSADVNSNGVDEHQTGGQVGEELQQWVIAQTEAAYDRGDAVVAFMHHGIVPHFEYEPVVLGDYLIKDYEAVSHAFADAGLRYIFTGHMHANDIAKVTTPAGNELYDIETGSIITYPSPIRSIDFRKSTDDDQLEVTADIRTRLIEKADYIDPETGAPISDLTAYGKEHTSIGEDVVRTLASSYVYPLLDTVYELIEESGGVKALAETLLGIEDMSEFVLEMLQSGLGEAGIEFSIGGYTLTIRYDESKGRIHASGTGINLYVTDANLNTYIIDGLFQQIDEKLLSRDSGFLEDTIATIIDEVIGLPIYDDGVESHNFLELFNEVYQGHLAGEESHTGWTLTCLEDIRSGATVDLLINTLIVALGDTIYVAAGELELNLSSAITTDSGLGGILSGIVKGIITGMVKNVGDVLDLAGLDIKELLEGLQDSILTDELKAELNDLVYGVAASMMIDDNHPEDNNTVIKTTAAVTAETKLNTVVLERVVSRAEAHLADEDLMNSLVSYVRESFMAAYEQARDILENPQNYEQADVNEAWAALAKEIQKLDAVKGNKNDLQELFDNCSILNLSQYVDGPAKNTFENALTYTREVLGNDDALQKEIDGAYDALLLAVNALVRKVVDKADLEYAVTVAESYDKNDYVHDGSWDTFQKLLKTAKDVFANENATAEEVEQALLNLVDAMMEIRLRADKSILVKAVTRALAIDLSGYTKTSAAGLEKVLTEAQEMLADNTLAEEDEPSIKAMAAKVEKAVNHLVKLSGAAGGDENGDDGSRDANADNHNSNNEHNNTDKNNKGQADRKTITKTTSGSSAKTGDNVPLTGLALAMLAAAAILAGSKKKKAA